MGLEFLFMVIGFTLASYAVVGNDSIQTLGTFIQSNSGRPWWVLFLYAGSILTVVLILGWYNYDGDVSWGRLTGEDAKFPDQTIHWYYILPPLALLFLTRFGFPVSTSFLVLLTFKPGALDVMLTKSLLGYAVAFGVSILLYFSLAHWLERWVSRTEEHPPRPYWYALQWLSTGWLWSMWLIQDLANIFVYLPRQLPLPYLFGALGVMLLMMAYIFANKGGRIQEVVRVKTNTADVRSATLIDFTYGCVLYYFKELSDVPMSTTWVFLGLLAGRELAIRTMFKYHENHGYPMDHLKPKQKKVNQAGKLMLTDLGKAAVGLIVSIVLAFAIRQLQHI